MRGMGEGLPQLFLDVFEPLPRQGPGSRACTARALALCGALPQSARVLDLGCGSGAQTLDLVELGAGVVVAVDLHRPSVERLRATVVERGLEHRIVPVVGDMARPCVRPASVDLVWSEGALYNVGLAAGLRIARDVLRPGGRLALTEAVWRVADPPDEVRAAFADYPAMGDASAAIAAIEAAGLALLGHFTLPAAAWWDDFYGPMSRRIDALRAEHAGDADALATLDALAQEPALRRRHGASYGYEFLVARKPDAAGSRR